MTSSNYRIGAHEWTRAPMDDAREAEIGRLIDRFYENCRADPVLGPVFEAHIDDWDAHLARMRDFWTSAIYRTGRYAGNPLELHRGIGELAPEHFDRWLVLWEHTVRQVVRTDVAGDLVEFPRRVARAMAARLGLRPVDSDAWR